jgi:hypothetical protein
MPNIYQGKGWGDILAGEGGGRGSLSRGMVRDIAQDAEYANMRLVFGVSIDVMMREKADLSRTDKSISCGFKP